MFVVCLIGVGAFRLGFSGFIVAFRVLVSFVCLLITSACVGPVVLYLFTFTHSLFVSYYFGY